MSHLMQDWKATNVINVQQRADNQNSRLALLQNAPVSQSCKPKKKKKPKLFGGRRIKEKPWCKIKIAKKWKIFCMITLYIPMVGIQ